MLVRPCPSKCIGDPSSRRWARSPGWSSSWRGLHLHKIPVKIKIIQN
uniref:Uncharacterized protein n=2 Tax=Anguilla anguilla TaxID=7936 RepID=A0A0E9UW06_ANGAN